MPLNAEQVLTDVNQVVCRVLKDNSIQLKPQTTANEVQGWDSLKHIEIVLAVEKHFKIRFNFSELQKFKNVGDMCENIGRRLAKV